MGIDLDQLGISLIAVASADNFKVYFKLCTPDAFDIPWVAQIDGDAIKRVAQQLRTTGYIEATLFKSKLDSSSYQKEDPERVKLLTIHAAKGTEYPVVVLIGLEAGILPDYRATQEEPRDNPRPIEEERRSCFVAVTRAMQELILVHTHDRPYKGSAWFREPSRFLLGMGPEIGLEFH